ncbi:hypothetical protein [Dokdonella sp.]|uniref:hypothetical protein n=1 Tax=Dokdonella sp. TaxID=2291710 RepID=UPI0037851FCD
MDRSNDLLRGALCARDPIPEAIADSLWLGGEAMIAPANLRELCDLRSVATESTADPSWLVI